MIIVPRSPARRVGLLLAVLFAFMLAFNVRAALAADYSLDWAGIGFVEGTSSLQTFTNVGGSGVDMTTEFRVLDAAFQDIGLYIPGTTALNQGMPKPVGDAMAVRDINVTSYPNAGYVLTRITFTESVQISDLWLESFYNWTGGPVRKHLALQAFDAGGNAVVPVNWTIYGGSSQLVVEPHPVNGQQWLRSSYADNQTAFTGASGIDYGTQGIRELHWYSWGYEPDGSLSNLLGSTYLGDFQFSLVPTAVSLVSVAAVAEPSTFFIGVIPAFLLLALVTLFLMRKRLFSAL